MLCWKVVLTANLSSRQLLPTPESPISSSCTQHAPISNQLVPKADRQQRMITLNR
jgi:hypothetical protein